MCAMPDSTAPQRTRESLTTSFHTVCKEILPTLTNAGKSLGTREELGNGDRTLFQAGTYIGQWGAPPVEASYIQMIKDQNGDILNGANDYAITFTPPKVSQFWSVTAYGSKTM